MSCTYKWVVDRNNFTGYAKTYLREDGCCPYCGKTAEEYISEGYSVLEDEEYFALVKEWENSMCGNWKEITDEEFEDALCVLPPVGWYDGGFFMGERYTGNISSFYQKLNGKFYTSLQRMSTPRKDIIEDLRKFISGK